MWDRFAELPRRMTPANVLKLKVDDMRAAGLSARKIEYLVDLALHFDSGAVHVDAWKDMADEEIIAELVGDPRHRPLDRRDVPDLPPDAAQRAAAGRRRA